MKPTLKIVFGAILILSCCCISSFKALADVKPIISIVTSGLTGPAAQHGLQKITDALQQKGISFETVASAKLAQGKVVVFIGLKYPKDILANKNPPTKADGFIIFRSVYHEKSAWIVCGADDRGLMYAELAVADHIGWSDDKSNPLSELKEATEAPALAERAVTLFTMNRAYWESRFYDETYWTRYLDMLARDRFNTISIIFGYENGGFLAPVYPYFFDVDGFSDIKMIGITAAQQQRNLNALNKLISMAHARGLNVTLGIWDHIYRGNVQGGGVPNPNDPLKNPTPGLVWGMNTKNLIPYTKAALNKFLDLVPGINTIQFRMHDESGLSKAEQTKFWPEIFALLQQKVPHMRLDLRAKGLEDETINNGLAKGLNLRISTKMWMEQMGMPFHPAHINKNDQNNRRHGYADMLHYPVTYQMHWEVWNAGTARMLLWADPDWVRRFVESTKIYSNDGFTFAEPLATKMEGQPHDMQPFDLLNAPYRYYDYEFERYWHYYQVFGLLTYNPNTPAEAWQHDFVSRFGAPAAPVIEKTLHTASGILTRIIASSYPYSGFPQTAGWPEKQHLGDLPSFSRWGTTDTQTFASFDEEAQALINNSDIAKVRPSQTSRWFAQTSRDILNDIAEAEKLIGPKRGKEFESTIVDLKILAYLALYHSRRIPAAVSYCIYEHTKDLAAFDDAITYQKSADEAWAQIVQSAGDVYASDLMFGARSRNLCGSWKTELAIMEKETVALEELRSKATVTTNTKPAPKYKPAPESPAKITITHQQITSAPAGKAIIIAAKASSPNGVKSVTLRYRAVDQTKDYETLTMHLTSEKDNYEATIPADKINPKWDLMYLLEVVDNSGQGSIYPDFNKEAPYIIVHLQR